MAQRHEAQPPVTPSIKGKNNRNGLHLIHSPAIASREASQAGDGALTASRRAQGADSPAIVQVAKVAVPTALTIGVGAVGFNIAHDHNPNIPNTQQLLQDAASLLGLGGENHPAQPAATATAGTTHEATATPAPKVELTSAQINADIAKFKDALPGHTFASEVQANGSVKFFDTTDGNHVEIAVYGATNVQTQDVYLDSNFNVTSKTDPKQMLGFNYVGTEGATLAHNLLITQQNNEVASKSKTISVMNPFDLPSGSNMTILTQHHNRKDGSEYTVVVYMITLPDGTKATLMNNSDGKSGYTQGGFTDPTTGQRYDTSGLSFSPLKYYEDPRNVVYYTNITDASGGIDGKNTINGGPLTAEAYSASYTLATPFEMDGAIVQVTQG